MNEKLIGILDALKNLAGKEYKVIDGRSDLNYIKLPVIALPPRDPNIEVFNNLYQYCKEQEKLKALRPITWTRSGGVSTDFFAFRPPMWGIKHYGSIELTLIDPEVSFRLQIRPKEKERKVLSGHKCYMRFHYICQSRFNIRLNDYFVSKEEGCRINSEIIQPPVELIDPIHDRDKIFWPAYHIDLNSAYLSGIIESYPVFREPLEYLYKMREKKKTYKDIMTHMTGYFRCSHFGYRLAHLTKAGIDYTRRRLSELSRALRKENYKLIAYNTDGIWYTEPNPEHEIKGPYHDDQEGEELGQWRNNKVNCRIRFKSSGAYEFEDENGNYTPVLRGHTIFEERKPRSAWEWGDIYHENQDIVGYEFRDDIGLIKVVYPDSYFINRRLEEEERLLEELLKEGKI